MLSRLVSPGELGDAAAPGWPIPGTQSFDLLLAWVLGHLFFLFVTLTYKRKNVLQSKQKSERKKLKQTGIRKLALT